MPFTVIQESPLAADAGPVELYYRERGRGIPLVFLHGGWGYEVYPFDAQIAAFADDFRIIIPDRSGYGRSMRLEAFPTDFHSRAAVETARLLDALNIERPVLWGHSDGAVIATMMALSAPQRFAGVVLEAFHYYRNKPGSREFFETMARDPDGLGERVSTALARDHGEDYWRKLIVNNGNAWLAIANESPEPKADLYGGRLASMSTPCSLIHGSRDPRTEPDELAAVRQELGDDAVRVIEVGGHSPHSERAAVAETNHFAAAFLRKVAQ